MNFSILSQAYPFNSSLKSKLLNPLIFGAFVALFLILFQPFGLSNYQADSKTWELLGYGLITTLSLQLNYLLFITFFPKWYSKKTWTVGKNILFTIYVFFFIGLSNLLYSSYLGFLHLDYNGFLFYQGVTITIGSIPVTISTLTNYNRKLKNALAEAAVLNVSMSSKTINRHQEIEIPSKNKKENLIISLDNLLAVSAIENYVEIYYLEGELQKKMVRNTLKNIKEVLSNFNYIQQCHRSYLVNLEKITEFNGNAQGLSLNFGNDVELQIPVSRKFVPEIKKALKED